MTTENSSSAPSSGSGSIVGLRVAPWVRIPRLELLLACPLDQLGWDQLESLVEGRVAEDLTLDFKRDLYQVGPGVAGSKGEAAKAELAKDVAAMANAAGGLIVLGIVEDDQGRAVELTGVPLSDAVQNAMTQAVAARVAPLPAGLVVHGLPRPGSSDYGLYVVLVPPSDAAPHGVWRAGSARWPVREGRTTRWMSEPELATRYRDRFAGASRQVERLDQATDEGNSRLDRIGRGWLALSMAPTRPGHWPAERETYRQWLRDYFTGVPWSLSVDLGVGLGRRRIIFTDQFHVTNDSTDHHIELHADGAGFAALALAPRAQNADALLGDSPLKEPLLGCDANALEFWTLALLDMLARHAVNTGASGDLAIRGQLVSNDPLAAPSFVFPWVLVEQFNVSQSVIGAHDSEQLGQRLVPGSGPLYKPEPLDLTVPITIVTTPSDLVASAAEIAREISAEFGATGTSTQLHTDGHVNPGDPHLPRSMMLSHWARDHDVLWSPDRQ